MKHFICIALFILIYNAPLFARQIEVGEGCEFLNLQDAVGHSEKGDHIVVHEGIYQVQDLAIDKQITVEGTGKAVLDAGGNGDILLISADSVLIKGLTFQNTGFSSIKDRAAVKILSAADVTVHNNTFLNNCFSITLSGAKNCIVQGNVIKGNAKSEFSSGNGIHLWKVENIVIKANQVTNHRDGIYLEFAENCNVLNNASKDNLRYGLHFMFSDGNRYIKNRFEKNGAGVAVMYSTNILMIENRFYHNWGTSSYGLLLKEISDSKIQDNTFIKNTVGVYMESCNRLLLEGNHLSTNGWAIKFLGSCERDTIRSNVFLKNTFDIITNSFTAGTNNVLDQNYWDKYRGYDLDHNQVGDVPHRPISLFSQYVERIPSSVVLLNSFTIQLLDHVERALPGFIPDNFADSRPKMKLKDDQDQKSY